MSDVVAKHAEFWCDDPHQPSIGGEFETIVKLRLVLAPVHDGVAAESAAVTGKMPSLEIDLNFPGPQGLKFKAGLLTACLRHGGGLTWLLF